MSEINKDTIISGTNKTLEQVAQNTSTEEIVIGDSNITEDTKAVINEVNYIPYVNQEVCIGATNPNNVRTWFKQSKNLLNIRNPIGSTADTFEILDNDWMHYVNSSGTAEQVVFPKILVKPNTKYSIFVETKDVTGAFFVMLGTYNNNTKIDTTYPNTSRVITTGSNINYLQFAITTSGMNTTGNYKIRIMVTKNTEIDTAYEPYVQTAININGNDEYYTNDYSTEEQVIGKWIDGKPIYRKVVDISNITSSNTNLVDITSLNVNQMIKIGGFVKYDNNTFPIPLTDSSTNYNVLFYNGRFLRGRLVMGTGGNLQNAYAIIEYTKTTD